MTRMFCGCMTVLRSCGFSYVGTAARRVQTPGTHPPAGSGLYPPFVPQLSSLVSSLNGYRKLRAGSFRLDRLRNAHCGAGPGHARLRISFHRDAAHRPRSRHAHRDRRSASATLAVIVVALAASGPLKPTLARFWMMPLYQIIGATAGTWLFVSAPDLPYLL